MAKTIRNAAGDESAVRTFHESGAIELRATVLAYQKRVDFHLFDLGPEQCQEISLLDLLDLAEDAHNPDGSKIEIGTSNLADFDFATVKDLKTQLQLTQGRVADLERVRQEMQSKLDAANAQIATLQKPPQT